MRFRRDVGSPPFEPPVESDWVGSAIPFDAIDVLVAFVAASFPLPSFSFAFCGRASVLACAAAGRRVGVWTTRLEVGGAFALVLGGFGPLVAGSRVSCWCTYASCGGRAHMAFELVQLMLSEKGTRKPGTQLERVRVGWPAKELSNTAVLPWKAVRG